MGQVAGGGKKEQYPLCLSYLLLASQATVKTHAWDSFKSRALLPDSEEEFALCSASVDVLAV